MHAAWLTWLSCVLIWTTSPTAEGTLNAGRLSFWGKASAAAGELSNSDRSMGAAAGGAEKDDPPTTGAAVN